MKFCQNCDVYTVCTAKDYLRVQGGYLWVQGGYLSVLRGYLGEWGKNWVGKSDGWILYVRWVGRSGGQVVQVGQESRLGR